MIPEEHAFTLGFGCDKIRSEFMNVCEELGWMELKDLLHNGMALPHVMVVIVASVLQLDTVFEKKAL